MKSIKQQQNECGTYSIARMMFKRNVTLAHALKMLAKKGRK